MNALDDRTLCIRPLAIARLAAPLAALGALLAPPSGAQCGLDPTGDLWDSYYLYGGTNAGFGDRVYLDEDWLLIDAWLDQPVGWGTILYRRGSPFPWGYGSSITAYGRRGKGVAADPYTADRALVVAQTDDNGIWQSRLEVFLCDGQNVDALPGLPSQLTELGVPVDAVLDPERVAFTDDGNLHVYRLELTYEYAWEATLAGLGGPYLALDGECLVAMGPASASCVQSGVDCERDISAFVHSGGTWVEETQLTPLIPTHPDDAPMAPVSLSGDLLAMSGYREGDPECSVLVYRRIAGNWALEAVLTRAAVAGSGEIELFGAGVAIQGDTLVVTSFAQPSSQMISHVFQWSGGSWTPRSSAIQAENVTRFGGTALDSGRFVFGAAEADTPLASPIAIVRTFALGAPHSVAEQPHDRTVDPGAIVSVEVELEEQGPPLPGTYYEYQWRRNGTPLSDNGHVLGTGTDRLTIWGANAFDVGLYDVLVTRTPCGEEIASQVARVGVLGGTPNETAELFDGAGGIDRYGRAVAIEGGRMLVGAPLDDEAGPDAGALFAYRETHGSWILDQKILPPTPGQGGGNFGNAVAMRGELAVVGEVGAEAQYGRRPGAVHFYRRAGNDWLLEDTIALTYSLGDAELGRSVALDGDRAVVGAPRLRVDNVNDVGGVYVFRRDPDGWVGEFVITAPNPQPGSKFGNRVALSGDVVVIGAPLEDTAIGTDSGAVRVWMRGGFLWNLTRELTPSATSAGARFGASVAATGNGTWIAAGAPRDDGAATNAGAVHVFLREDTPTGPVWDERAKRFAPDATSNDRFGYSAALSGGLLVVGARLGNGAVDKSGSAYLFHGSSFPFVAELHAADGAADDRFGDAVATDGAQVAVGAILDDTAGTNAGSVSVFDL